MTKQPRRAPERRGTKAERLLVLLEDERWHSTQELVRRIGHTFAVAKFYLVQCGYCIEKRPHQGAPHQWQYRLTDEPRA